MKLRVIIALSSAALLTLALALVSTAGPTCLGDADSDGVCDVEGGGDNCLGLANPAQRDDDEDGYGNICDTDTNQDCVAGAGDLTGVFGNFGGTAPWAPKNGGAFDVNEDNTIGAADLTAVFGAFGSAPGPSGKSCADCTATPTTGLGLGTCP
jgi:hypothetical protein